MDARPQRPIRSRTIRDENLLPTVAAAKTIHQRNKSSPALSSLAQAHATKPGSKRTVFADVSNTIRSTRLVKDDSAIGAKPADLAKKAQPLETRTNAPLARPAQRPLSVTTLKNLLNSVVPSAASTESRPSSSDDASAVGTSHLQSRRLLPKKSTAVFKDTDVARAQSSIPNTEGHRTLSGLPTLPVAIDEATKHTQVDNVATSSALSNEVHASRATESVYASVPESYHASRDEEHEHLTAVASLSHDQSLIPQESWPKPSSQAVSSEQVSLPLSSFNTTSHLPMAIHNATLEDSGRHDYQAYWEDEVIPVEEPYVDDGYITVKSRGDCTTGATTIVLSPKITVEVEQELAAATLFVRGSAETIELEDDELWDTSMVAEYGEEIFDYMRGLEEMMRPNPYYMANQVEVQWSMRSVLMDWLVQVHHRFGLLPETLFLCANLVDRFLSCKVVSLGKLQLVGATAIFIASKYEEINCPSIQEIVYMVDNGYTIDEILKAERFMLSMLQFELGWPGPMSFLRRISKADDYDLETRTLAKYFLEVTIMDERFVGCIPSFVAAGAHCIARLMLRKGTWSRKHVHYSNYTYSQLRPLLMAMLSCCEEPSKHHTAVFDKYRDKRFKRASLFVQAEMLKDFKLPPFTHMNLITNTNKECGKDLDPIKQFS
ncbi:MAG: hypothetical protein M1828_005439 [Chrysothrix sp. TS-e1954]|nr:MAG: hypothetical protein M1828_005439 [Chrysothrix sp. TS-e1954]